MGLFDFKSKFKYYKNGYKLEITKWNYGTFLILTREYEDKVNHQHFKLSIIVGTDSQVSFSLKNITTNTDYTNVDVNLEDIDIVNYMIEQHDFSDNFNIDILEECSEEEYSNYVNSLRYKLDEGVD